MSLEEHCGFSGKSHFDYGKPIEHYIIHLQNTDVQSLNEKSLEIPNISPNGSALLK